MKRFFHFSYLRSGPTQAQRVHELRDGDAFAELALALAARGWIYGGLLVNRADPDDAGMPVLSASDLLVLTTRPPLHDDDGWDRKHIPRSGTLLERQVLAAVGRYFDKCRRSSIRLQEEAAVHLAGDAADRAEILFHVYKGSRYRQYRDPYGRGRGRYFRAPAADATATAAFLVCTPLTPGGPRLLNAFGMDGATTLVWCYLLRTRFPHLLDDTRVVMAELESTPGPQRPSTLAFADAWPVRLLLDWQLASRLP